MLKVILFDFDGTIADSFENFLEIINKLSLKYNLPAFPREDIEKLRSEGPKTLIKALQIPIYKIPLLARDMKKMQMQQMAQIKPFNGLPQALHKLKSEGYQLGIITSNGKENVELFVKQNKIDVFTYIFSDTGMFGKDKVIRKFLKQNAVTKDEAIYIGDEIRDILASQKVGIKVVAVTWGFNSKQGLARYQPDFLIDNPEELLTVLENK